MSSFKPVLDTTFSSPSSHEVFNLLRGLYVTDPSSQHVPVLDDDEKDFPLSEYLHSLDITPSVVSKVVFPNLVHGKVTFVYEGTAFTVFKATWRRDHSEWYFYDLVYEGASDELGKKLATAVYVYGATLREEIWVYQSARWKADKKLFKAVQAADWDDVVLEDAFKEGLQRDTSGFFASREIYEELGITWKRGILLLGPPGNGKTESIKALLKDAQYPALYVKSFTTPYGPEYGVRSIFDHARQHSPCILVLEDLDAMVTPKVRSFFLNELDGIAANGGILTIATTNHPERIDDAILNRPSRFDVKYNFALPSLELRTAFATRWVAKVAAKGGRGSGIQFGMKHEEIAAKVARDSEGFSFAFLKELFVSFLLQLAHARSSKSLSVAPEELLFKQIEVLTSQIIKTPAGGDEKQKDKKADEGEDSGNDCWVPADPVEKTLHGGTQF
ncbi:P-loop containing nucleoside triphosphate hydrolase protein [Amylostereum chailletii]|nr:P-loop containing nucleoside triphosphate hydrolase protein [Amylostereum chailletii]